MPLEKNIGFLKVMKRLTLALTFSTLRGLPASIYCADL